MVIAVTLARGLRLSVAAAMLVPSLASADEVRCPSTVGVDQKARSAPDGWSVSYDPSSHPFASVTFYDGRPEESMSLVHDSESKTTTQSAAVWRFLPSTDRRIWIACRYSGTSATLSKALPIDTKTCTVTYSLRETIGGFPAVKKIDCK